MASSAALEDAKSLEHSTLHARLQAIASLHLPYTAKVGWPCRAKVGRVGQMKRCDGLEARKESRMAHRLGILQGG